MKFLVDDNNKVIFGWSAKCGCSHIKKIFWFFQNDNINNVIHTEKDFVEIQKDIDISKYKTVLFIRNPYRRLVSGFLQKYHENGEFRNMWHCDTITFSKFVEILLKENWNMIEKHHFCPQTSEDFNKIDVFKSKSIKIYDIENINYIYIEGLYNKIIPKELLCFKGGHERQTYNRIFENDVYNLDMPVYYEFDVSIEKFYNQDIKNKVLTYYKNDFDFFKQHGFDYENYL